MFKTLVLLTTCAAAVFGRRSPNAGLVERKFDSRQGSRYSNNVLEDAALDVPGLISKYGYPVEVHTVDTADGYLLELHRIPHGRDNNNKSGPRLAVLVMHGLLSSSADFLVMGPGNALGYHLAEAGYDVWLGNARGNYYSRKHLTLNPERNDFWRFSWDEMGNYDLPAVIDHIVETTGEEKIHYIGHSQGGTSFLVMNSLRPEYNERIISFQGLAPASFFTHSESVVIKSLAPLEAVIETAAWAIGMGEIFGGEDFLDIFREHLCSSVSIAALDALCDAGISSRFVDREYYNATMLPVILGHTPAGASIRQVAHFGQVVRFDLFRRYNYALSINNLAAYGRLTPPEYNLSLVTAPSYLHYGLADNEVHYKDVLKLASLLPNVVKVNKMNRDSFNHFDFMWGIDATEQVYNGLVESMKEAENKFL